MVDYEHNTISLDEHCRIIEKYRNQLKAERASAQASVDHGIHIHDAMMHDLNIAISLLKDHNLLAEYYSRTE